MARSAVARWFAPLAAAGLCAGLPSPAQATVCSDGVDRTSCGGWHFTASDGAAVSSSFGLISGVVGLLPLLSPSGSWKFHRANRTAQIYWFATGGVAVGLGALGVAIQASPLGDSCSSGDACRVNYGLGAAALGTGAVCLTLGIVLSATPAPPGAVVSRIVPVPILLRTEHGPAAGLGLAGINF